MGMIGGLAVVLGLLVLAAALLMPSRLATRSRKPSLRSESKPLQLLATLSPLEDEDGIRLQATVTNAAGVPVTIGRVWLSIVVSVRRIA
jgi:hypothetical protein